MNRSLLIKRLVVAALLLGAESLIAWYSFRLGERRIAGPAVVKLANDECFDCWAGLTALKDTNQAKMALLVDRELDYSSSLLARMALEQPKLIQRTHYNLLIRVRNYRIKFGRYGETNSTYDPAQVDEKVSEAIKFLESTHDTNTWGVPTLEEMIDQAQRSKN